MLEIYDYKTLAPHVRPDRDMQVIESLVALSVLYSSTFDDDVNDGSYHLQTSKDAIKRAVRGLLEPDVYGAIAYADGAVYFIDSNDIFELRICAANVDRIIATAPSEDSDDDDQD